MNDSFLSSPTKDRTPENVLIRPKAKYEPKLLIWIAISERGLSQPYFRRSGLAINQNVYLNECIIKRLIPFINAKHSDNNYLFWPDKASSHYANTDLNHFRENDLKFVSKYRNPTNVPQCRPIEDLFAILTKKVYANGWRAETIHQLQCRVKKCIRELNPNVVKRLAGSVRKRLRIAGRRGPLAVVH